MKKGRMGCAFALGFLLALTVVAMNHLTGSNGDDDPQEVNYLAYPYVASEERRRQLLDGYPNVVPGQREGDVQALLGKPDTIRPLYKPWIFRPPLKGYTLWYYLDIAKQDYGSFRGIRVCFDRLGFVEAVDAFLEESNPR
jgi:hypothetical protein